MLDAQALRAAQAPLKDRYRQQPETALVELTARGVLDGEGVTCLVERRTGDIAGLHPAAGGDGSQLCSGDMLLEALVACAGVTLMAVATAMGVVIRRGLVEAAGDLDFRGTLGVVREIPVGFVAIRLGFALDTDSHLDALDKLLKLTDRYCVVSQSLATRPVMTIAKL